MSERARFIPDHSSFEDRYPDFGSYISGLYVRYLRGLLQPGQLIKPKILTLGCGNSMWLEMVLLKEFPRAVLISGDVHWPSLVAASDKSRAKLVQLSAASLPIKQESLDAVIINGAIGSFGTDKQEIALTLAHISDKITTNGLMMIHTVSDSLPIHYRRYQKGSMWIAHALRGLGLFENTHVFTTSNEFMTEMIVAQKMT